MMPELKEAKLTIKEAKLTKKERDALNKSLRVSKRPFKRQYPDDLVGFRFGELVVLRKLLALSNGQGALWECVTDCNYIIQATTDDLISGRAKDCNFRPSPPAPPKSRR